MGLPCDQDMMRFAVLNELHHEKTCFTLMRTMSADQPV